MERIGRPFGELGKIDRLLSEPSLNGENYGDNRTYASSAEGGADQRYLQERHIVLPI